MNLDLYVAELTAYDPGLPGTRTLYFSSAGFCSLPTDTPANTAFDARIIQPSDVIRDLFDSGTTSGRSRMTFGDLVLLNPDGGLDAMLTYGFDGRFIIIRRGAPGAAYPASFQTVFSGTMEQPEAEGDYLRIKLRDWQLTTQQPLQTTKYAGSNVFPAGLEGTANDLKGKPKPVCFGSVLNVPCVLVNSAKLIYQVNDGAVQALGNVYDSGVPLGLDLSAWSVGSSSGFGANVVRAMTTGIMNESSPAAVSVAVGDAGVVSLTTDGGVNWQVDSGTGFGATNLYCVAFGKVHTALGIDNENAYIIGGAGGALRGFNRGPSGTVFSMTSNFAGNAVRGLYYARKSGLWVAVGDGGKISTSTDFGATWTARASGVATALYGVTWNGTVFVVVGASGVLLTSPDGTTWTSQTSGFGASDITSVAYGNGIFLAVGAGDKIARCVLSSGVTWTLTNPIVGNSSALRGIWFDTLTQRFMVVGDNESIASTSDGIVWTVHEHVTGSGTHFLSVARADAGTWFASTGGSIYTPGAVGTYANTTQLQDDTLAPVPGSYKTYLAGGYFRLGSPPAGQVTADVTQGAAAANRTAGQLFGAVLTKGGLAGTWNTTDVTNLDTANSAVCGFWTDQEVTIAEVLDQVAASVGAAWWTDLGGVFRIKQLIAPTGSPVLTITASDLLKPLARIPTRDATKGLPSWRTIVRYGRNYTVQETGVAGGVSDARKVFLASEWLEAKAEDAAVQTIHSLAPQTVEETLLLSASDAATEASRRQTLRGVQRHRYEAVLQLNDETDALDVFNLVALQHARYGLSAGVNFWVIGVKPDARARTLTLTLWG